MVTECRCRKGLGKKGNGLDRLVVAGCSNILKTQTSNLQIFKFQIFKSSNVNVSPVSGSLQLSVYRLLCFPTVASWPVALPMAPRCPRFDARAAPRPGAEGGGALDVPVREDRGQRTKCFEVSKFRVSNA